MAKKRIDDRPDDTPATARQLAAAAAVLGRYAGANTDAEHAEEAARVGGETYYRMLLANTLLGLVEAEAMFADGFGVPADQMIAAHHQSLVAVGADEDPGKLLGFLRWRAVRISGRLSELAQDEATGPVVLAAAHAGEGLQTLLGVCQAGQHLDRASPEAMTADLKAARKALTSAVTNIDIMLRLIQQAESHFPRKRT